MSAAEYMEGVNLLVDTISRCAGATMIMISISTFVIVACLGRAPE